MGELIEYKIVRENLDGKRGKRNKTLYRWDDDEQLTIGGLYMHLGPGYPGMQRVLSARKTGDKNDE